MNFILIIAAIFNGFNRLWKVFVNNFIKRQWSKFVGHYLSIKINGPICIYIVSTSPPRPPLKLGRGGFLFSKFGQRRGSSKNYSEIGGRGGGRGRVPNVFISFPLEKHVFITIEILFLSGKYSRLL